MSGSSFGLAASVFLSCAVEAVEAFTIVLAVSISRRASSALLGSALALLSLAVLVAALGSALTALPVAALQLVIGVALLGLGLQWLRKAVLRAAGAKAIHDEEAIFATTSAAAGTAPAAGAGRVDPYAFVVAFKAVLLEGLEVVLIVIGFGAGQGRMALAAAVGVAAVLVVGTAGLALRAPLARVPENTMKFAVGVLITAFGIFWTAEGCGLEWPGGEAAALGLAALVLLAALAAVARLRRRRSAASGGERQQQQPEDHQRPATAGDQPHGEDEDAGDGEENALVAGPLVRPGVVDVPGHPQPRSGSGPAAARPRRRRTSR